MLGAFAMGVLLASISGIYAIMQLRLVDTQYSVIVERMENAKASAAAVVSGMYQQASAVRGYGLYKDSSNIAKVYDANDAINKNIEALSGYIVDASDQEYIASLKSLNRQWRDLADKSIALIQQGKLQTALDAMTNVGLPITGEYLRIANLLSEKYSKLVEENVAQAARKARTAQSVAVYAFIFALMISFVIAYVLAQKLTSPILTVVHAADRLADGDLTIDNLDVTTDDEAGDMAQSFNKMLDSLRHLIHEVYASAESVAHMSRELNAASEQSAAAAQNAAQAVQQLASGATEQAHEADYVKTTMEQLQQTIQQIAGGSQQTAADVQQALGLFNLVVETLDHVADNTVTVTENTTQVKNTANQGAIVVERAVEAMEHIEKSTADTALRIQELDELSKRIGQITDVISGVADQTNLLALNAAIEAARAGEHGRGFAVVAEEVRKLAERSDASAHEIADLITSIQAKTNDAVAAMKAGADAVQTGSKLAKDAGSALHNISEAVANAAQEIQGISVAAQQVRMKAQEAVRAFDSVAAVTEENTAGTEEMAAAASQVTTSMENVAPIAQRNATMAEKLTATIEELSASSEEVSSSAGSLAMVAQSLLKQVSEFKIRDAHAESVQGRNKS